MAARRTCDDRVIHSSKSDRGDYYNHNNQYCKPNRQTNRHTSKHAFRQTDIQKCRIVGRRKSFVSEISGEWVRAVR